MPSIAVINAATGVGSGRFGYREKLGRIEPGLSQPVYPDPPLAG